MSWFPPEACVRVVFEQARLSETGDVGGSGEVYFVAKVNGAAVGDPKKVFDMRDGGKQRLHWASEAIPLAGLESLSVEFEAYDEDTFCDDRLGRIAFELTDPIWGGLDTRRDGYVSLDYEIVLTGLGREVTHEPDRVGLARQPVTDNVITTVSGTSRRIRCEIHPVTPTPTDYAPPRPEMPIGSAHPWTHPGPGIITPNSPLNAIYNPPVIPILSKDEATAATAASIELTYIAPSSWDFGRDEPSLTWTVRSLRGSPAVSFLDDDAVGTKVLVYGTAPGEVVLEVRCKDVLVATFRALVDHVRKIPLRVNLVNGPDEDSLVPVTPQHVLNHVAVANILFRQLAIELVYDERPAVKDDGALPCSLDGETFLPGIFITYVDNAGDTRRTPGLNAVALNHREGAINLAYIHSGVPYGRLREVLDDDKKKVLGDDGRVLTYREHIESAGGRAVAVPRLPVRAIYDDETPSASWLPPCGIPPEGAAVAQKMGLLSLEQHTDGRAGAWVCCLVNNIENNGLMGSLIAHELGHTLFLAHRGSAEGLSPAHGDLLEYPNQENVMGYGAPANQPAGLSFDILQAKAVRLHPLVAD